MVATYSGVLTGTERAEAIQRLPGVAEIRADMLIKGPDSPRSSSGLRPSYAGNSGATIIYAYVTPAATDRAASHQRPLSAGFYYIKVNQPESDPQVNLDRARRMELLQDSPPSGTVPVVSFVIYHQYLVEMTESAFPYADSDQQIKTLTYLLKYRTRMTQRYLRGVTATLLTWAEDLHDVPLELEAVFQQMFEGTALRDTGDNTSRRSIAHRARMMFKQLRMQDAPEDQSLEIDEALLVTALHLNFIGETLLPNPIAYINDPNRLRGSTPIPYPSAFSHYDLHCDNVICDTLPASASDDTLNPDIIDLTDYKQRFPIFWDFLYLEFDLLLRAGSPTEAKHRRELMRLVRTLTSDKLDGTMSYDGSPLFQSIYDSIQILRDGVQDFLGQVKDVAVRRKYKRAFWTIATGVGLNFMRKSSVHVQGRMLGLFYAACAFKRVLEGEGRTTDDTAGEAFIVPDWRQLEVMPQTAELDQYLDQTLNPAISEKHPVVICIGPQVNRLLSDDLRTAINDRLRWWVPSDDFKAHDTLNKAVEQYQSLTSELNLTTLVRRHSYSRHENPALIEKLIYLAQHIPNLTLVTTSWYDPLLPPPDIMEIASTRPVLYLAGHADVEGSLHTRSEIRSDTRLDSFTQAEHDHLCDLIADPNARVIFLGNHAQEPLWETLFSDVAYVDYFDSTSPGLQVGRSFNFYHHSADDFVHQFSDHYQNRPDLGARPRLRKTLDHCQSPGIDQQELQSDIVYQREQRLWMIYDVPWRGKTTFLRMLARQHSSHDTIEQPIRRNLLIDFDQHPNLRDQRRAVVALLLDHFHAEYPPYHIYIERSDREKLDLLREALFACAALNTPDADYLVCIDGLNHDDPYLLEWLRDDLAPALAKCGVTVVFSLRAYTPLKESDPVPLSYARWHDRYEVRSLQRLRVLDIKELIMTYVREVNWGDQEQAILTADLEYWAHTQARAYKQLGRDSLMLVDRLLRHHLKQMDHVHTPLGQWPPADQQPLIEQQAVFETIWHNIRRELALDELKPGSYRVLLDAEDDEITQIVGEHNPLEDFYRDILACRRLTTQFVDEWSARRKITLPKFIPTIINELQSLSYIRYDDRANQLTLDQRYQFPPTYYVLEIIYTTIQRYLYQFEIKQGAAREAEASTFYKLMDHHYFQANHLASKAEEQGLDMLFVANAADALYYGVLLELIDRHTKSSHADLSEFLLRMHDLNIPVDRLRRELQTIHIDWQIDEAQPRLTSLINSIKS